MYGDKRGKGDGGGGLC